MELDETPCELVYYSAANSFISKCPIEMKSAFVQSATSNALPGSCSVVIPNADVLQRLFLQIKLKDIAGTYSSFNLSRGWGFGLIDNIQFRVGSAAPMVLYGSQLSAQALLQCESRAKKEQLLALAGPPLRSVNGTGVTFNESYYTNAALPVTSPVSMYKIYDAIVPLGLPFLANMRASGSGLPLDLSLLNQAITVTINFRSMASIIKGTDASSICAAAGYAATSITFIGRQGRFKNPSDSLATKLIREPAMSYNHFMQMVLGPADNGKLQQTPTDGWDTAESPTRFSVNLVGIPPGNCVAAQMWLVKESDYLPSTTAGACANVLRTYLMKDVQLYWNGQLYANLPGSSHVMMSTLSHESDGACWPLTVTEYSGGQYQNGPAYMNYVTEIDFSMLCPSETGAQLLQAGSSFQATQLTCSFTAEYNSANDWHLFVAYTYNSSLQISNQGMKADYIV